MKIKHKKFKKVTVLHKGVSYLIQEELEVTQKIGEELLKANKNLIEIKEIQVTESDGEGKSGDE